MYHSVLVSKVKMSSRYIENTVFNRLLFPIDYTIPSNYSLDECVQLLSEPIDGGNVLFSPIDINFNFSASSDTQVMFFATSTYLAIGNTINISEGEIVEEEQRVIVRGYISFSIEHFVIGIPFWIMIQITLLFSDNLLLALVLSLLIFIGLPVQLFVTAFIARNRFICIVRDLLNTSPLS
jgi:hypothetical protein